MELRTIFQEAGFVVSFPGQPMLTISFQQAVELYAEIEYHMSREKLEQAPKATLLRILTILAGNGVPEGSVGVLVMDPDPSTPNYEEEKLAARERASEVLRSLPAAQRSALDPN